MNHKTKVKIYIGTDHAGFELKEELRKYLLRSGYDVVDCGAEVYSFEDDYPDYVIPAALGAAKSNGRALAIVFGGSGIGECIAANKVQGVRAALVYDCQTARLSREHNNANVLCLGGRTVTKDIKLAKRIVKVWLETSFSKHARHERRLKKIQSFERGHK
ncbi:MAG: ribose-5-phosphate isomerase [Patescibacteria group bacterium]